MAERYLLTDDACQLWTSEQGSGWPVVLCHGGPGIADYLQPMSDLLASRYRVLRWDQRGCGRSSLMGPYTLDRHVRDLALVISAFADTPVVLIGHSWGATLALRYAMRFPDTLASLVYVSGVGLGGNWKQEWKQNVAERLSAADQERIAELRGQLRSPEEERELAVLQWSADFTDRRTSKTLAAQLAEPWFPVNYESNAALSAESAAWDHQGLLVSARELNVPTLVVDGADDPRPRYSVDSLYESLPNAERVTLPDAGHLPWIEKPESFRTSIQSFLDR